MNFNIDGVWKRDIAKDINIRCVDDGVNVCPEDHPKAFRNGKYCRGGDM